MQQLVDFEFQWWRDAKGYEVVDTPPPIGMDSRAPSERWPISGVRFTFPAAFGPTVARTTETLPLFPGRIVRLGGDLVPYRPLEIIDDIFRAYINLVPTREAVFDFVDRYGPLTHVGLNENHGESMATAFSGVQDMNLYIDARLSDDPTAIRRLLPDDGITIPDGIVPKLSYDPGIRAPKLRFWIRDMQTALWLHLMESFDRGTSLRRCEWEKCGIVFEAGAGTGRRADSKFGCDQHRIAYHSVHRTPAPATGRPRGRPRRAPA